MYTLDAVAIGQGRGLIFTLVVIDEDWLGSGSGRTGLVVAQHTQLGLLTVVPAHPVEPVAECPPPDSRQPSRWPLRGG